MDENNGGKKKVKKIRWEYNMLRRVRIEYVQETIYETAATTIPLHNIILLLSS